ncbi:MAG: hypothetical protein R3C14_10410 [Caldilineaceae bacterium]
MSLLSTVETQNINSQNRFPNGQPPTDTAAETSQSTTKATSAIADAANQELMKYLQNILEDCQQDIGEMRAKLGYTYWIIIAMCISMFLFGFALLSIPLWRQQPLDQSLVNLLLPVGLGIANLLALYLYKPLERIQKLMADMGQITIAFNSFQTQVALRLIGTNLDQRETMGVAAKEVDHTAEIVLKQIRDYFEELASSKQ